MYSVSQPQDDIMLKQAGPHFVKSMPGVGVLRFVVSKGVKPQHDCYREELPSSPI